MRISRSRSAWIVVGAVVLITTVVVEPASAESQTVSLVCAPDANPENKTVRVGVFTPVPLQETVKIRLDLSGKVAEVRDSVEDSILERSSGLTVSESSYKWTARDLPGDVHLAGTIDRETGRVTVTWLQKKAVRDISMGLQAFVGVCRLGTRKF